MNPKINTSPSSFLLTLLKRGRHHFESFSAEMEEEMIAEEEEMEEELTHTHTHTHTRVCMLACACVCAFVCVCVLVCVSIFLKYEKWQTVLFNGEN